MEREDTKEERKKESSLVGLLLDSSLIQRTTNNKKLYNLKLINCNGYIQLYSYGAFKTKKDDSLESTSEKVLNNRGVVKRIIGNESNKSPITNNLKEIRIDNALRSKLSLERLIKANCEEFKSFITLTFKENVSDINIANKMFNNWRYKIKKKYPSFKYVCVPEFQKRGAVHYHLVSNLSLNSDLVALQNATESMYDVAYWDKGFTSAFEIKDINVVSYMSKYMTKDITDRLFARKRYFYSKNLKMPKTEFINMNDCRASKYVEELISNMKVKYSNIYLDKLTNGEILFSELTSYNIYYVKFYKSIKF